ncbi:MAG: hypothetical protein H7Z21_02495 [Hymenobacter sp.]|nr:hypothetical protein [Hymenobacter sp.]
MRKLLLSALLAFPLQAAQAQTPPAPPAPRPTTARNDDTILVDLTDTPEAGWRRLAQVLVRRGYSIEHSDKDLLTLSTHALYLSQPFRVAATVIDRTVVLRMYGRRVAADILLTERVQRRGSANEEWRELETIARELGGVIRYATSGTQ